MATQPNNAPQWAGQPMFPGQHKNWLRRNWMWLLFALFLCGAAFLAGIFALITGVMRSADVVKEAVARAQSNPHVVQRLGSPVKEGWWMSGSINVSTSSGDADLSVPISGPKGRATVYVTAQKTAGLWTYSVMEVVIAGSGERIDLLASASQGASPAIVSVATTPSSIPAAPMAWAGCFSRFLFKVEA